MQSSCETVHFGGDRKSSPHPIKDDTTVVVFASVGREKRFATLLPSVKYAEEEIPVQHRPDERRQFTESYHDSQSATETDHLGEEAAGEERNRDEGGSVG